MVSYLPLLYYKSSESAKKQTDGKNELSYYEIIAS